MISLPKYLKTVLHAEDHVVEECSLIWGTWLGLGVCKLGGEVRLLSPKHKNGSFLDTL